jgi:GNAT superfamily N-acetyltransferase
MDIRQIEEKDIDDVLEMIIAYRKEQGKQISGVEKEKIKHQLETVVREKSDTTYVCIIQDQIAGYMNMHLCPFPMLGGLELYISDLLVKQEFRGKGMGREFLRIAEKRAQKHGCVRLMLNNAKDAVSYKRSFYGKSGFTERTHFANFVKTLISHDNSPTEG